MVAKKPPMGWNSWDCYGAAVDEETVRRNALYMSRRLKAFGWEYIVVDIQWSEPTAQNHEYHPFTELCMDEYGRLIPAENRFPSAANGAGFAPLAEYIHSLGLKFGIHIMRGIPRQAVHADVKIKNTDIGARKVAATASICMWNTDMYGINADADGAAQYYDSLFELYASWGVDFVKVDDIANHYAYKEIELIRAAIEKSGREMVLSLSPGPAPLEQAEHLKQYANMWRITDDFWDKWELLYAMFERAEKWCVHAGAGHWPDADMLPIGAILQDYNTENWTAFTEDEQVTMLSLWCMMRSPLMMGGEMSKNDAFTEKLLTNRGILEMHEVSFGAHQIYKRTVQGHEWIVWAAYRADGGGYIAVFHTGAPEEAETAAEWTVSLPECGMENKRRAKELWSDTEAVLEDGCLRTERIPLHGAKVYRVYA